jgi:hypothetical protein
MKIEKQVTDILYHLLFINATITHQGIFPLDVNG